MPVGTSTIISSEITKKKTFTLRVLPPSKMPPASKKGFGVKAKPSKDTAETKVTTPKLTSKDFKVFSEDSSDDDTFKKTPANKSKAKPVSAKEMNGKKTSDSESSSDDEDGKLEAKKQKALAARAGLKSKESPAKQKGKKKQQSKFSDASTEESSDEEDTAAKGKPSRPIQTPVKQTAKVSTPKKSEAESSSGTESEEERQAPPVRKPSMNTAKQTTSKLKSPQKAPPPESDLSEEENSDDQSPVMKNKAGDKSPAKNASDPQKSSDISAGHALVMSMPSEDFHDFIQRLKESCDVLDKHKPSTTIEALDWNKFAFKEYTGTQLRNVCLYMIWKRRATRNLWEYVNEVEHEAKAAKGDYRKDWIKSHPEYPKKPPNTAHPTVLYVVDLYNQYKERGEKLTYFDVHKKHHSEFQNLPTKKQHKYIEKSAKANEEYQNRLQAFYKKVGYVPEVSKRSKTSRSTTASSGPKGRSHSAAASKNMFPDAPELPSPPEKLFAKAQVEKLHPDAEGKERETHLVQFATDYLALDHKHRLKYIKKCIRSAQKFEQEAEEYMQTHPGYAFPAKGRIRSLIQGPELAIWESANGRPEQPPNSVQEMYKAELIEKGEFNSDDYENEVARKAALAKKYKSMNWMKHSEYEVKRLQAHQAYCSQLKEYYENAPAIMKPLIKATIPQKLRSEVLGEDAPVPSPRKRKADKPVDTPSVEEDTAPKKSKKHKKDKERSEENETAEAAVEEIAAVGKASSHKKKKKITLLNEIVRGIFDARPALGRSYSVYYYYAKQACTSKVWVQRLDSDGVIETAGMLIRSYMNMSDSAKEKWELRQSQRLNTALFQVKQEDGEEENLDTMFLGEPVPPPPGLWDYYRKTTPGSKRRPWKYADWEAKTSCAKEHHQAMKQYIRDFENYVLRMTPTDLALYTAAKSDIWQSHSKNTLDQIVDNTAFLATSERLVREVCPDSEDSLDSPIMLAIEPTNVAGQCNRRISTKSVFSNDDFLRQLEGYLEK